MKKLFTLLFAIMASTTLFALGRNDGTSKANAIEYDWDNGVYHYGGTKWYRVDLSPLYDGANLETLSLDFTNPSITETANVTCQIMYTGNTESIEQTIVPEASYRSNAVSGDLLVSMRINELFLWVSSTANVNLKWQLTWPTGDSCDDAKIESSCADCCYYQEPGTKWYSINAPHPDIRNDITGLAITSSGNTTSVNFMTDCNSPAFDAQTYTFDNFLFIPASDLTAAGWPNLLFTCTSTNTICISYSYIMKGLSCDSPKDLAWDTVNHEAGTEQWYLLQVNETSIPENFDLRLHFTNTSTDQNNTIEIGIYFDCFDPSFLNKNYQQLPEEDYYIDIDRDLMDMLGWPYMLLSCSSEKAINIWSELIPDMPREFVHDTIIDYICQGDTYWDPITNVTISSVEHSLTYNDTIPFYDGLLIKDSIIVHQIRPVVVPEPLSLEAMQSMGAAPQLVQGMQLSVTESSALLTDYYRYLGQTVDTFTYMDTVYWAKPVYKSDGSLDVTQEASLDLSKWYSTNDHFDTLLLVVRSEDCYVVQRIPYIFPITASSCISASGTCGNNLTWELTCDSVLTISGTGAMWRLTEEQAWRPYKEQIKTAILPEGLDSIAPKAFYQCTNLTSVNMPNSVRALGTKAFVECYKLAEPVYNERIFAFLPKDYSSTYSVPEGIVSVAAYAISYLLPTAESNAIPSSLKEIVLPSSLKRLGISSLAGAQLEKITCYATTPPVCAQSVFDYYYDEVGIVLHSIDRSIPVYVPAESVEAYKAADQWSSFINILPIEEPIETVEADYNVVYTGHDDNELSSEFITLHVPVAPEIEGFTFLKWQVVAGDLEDGIVIEAVYSADAPSSAPAVYTDPANPAQKLIRDGNVYILKGNKTYTITGQEL